MASRIRVLFLAANPLDSGYHLRVDEEAREIDEKIQFATRRDCFEFVSLGAVRRSDLQRALLRYEPSIIHFSGHGSKTEGIMLEDASGNMAPLSKEALGGLLEILQDSVRMVVLNACYSAHHIEVFSQFIDYSIGMNKVVGDEAAIVFAASFYQALAYGKSVDRAFRLAKNQLQIDGIAESDIPELFAKPGVDASAPFLAQAVSKNSEPPIDDPAQKRSNSGELIGSIEITGSEVGQINTVKGDGSVFIGTHKVGRNPNSKNQ